MSYDLMICHACVLIDGPAAVQPTRCTFCPRCNAWLCDRCLQSKWRRPLAALLSKLKQRAWALVPLLLLIGLAVTPARAQSFCGAGLQAIPGFNVSDNLNKPYQGACWDPAGHIITLPLTSIGGGTVTAVNTLTNLGLVLGAGGSSIRIVTGTSGGVPYWQTGSTINSSPALGANQLVFGQGPGGAPLTNIGFNVDLSNPAISNLQLGVTGSATGELTFFNTGTGFITMRPVTTGALGTPLIIIPAASGTIALTTDITSQAVLLNPSADQTITGGFSLYLSDPNGRLGIGMSTTPTSRLEIIDTAGVLPIEIHSANAQGADFYTHDATSSTATRAPFINLIRSNGTQAAPTAILSGQRLGDLQWQGYDGTAYGLGPNIQVFANENWTNIAHGTVIRFANVAANGTTLGTNPLQIFSDQIQLGANINLTSSGSSTVSFTQYLTNTNCAAVGTTANPSVASCAAASAGAFSCATNASAGTCQVNTTAVTANSEITVTENSSEGTRLGVTCNTSPSVVPAIILASKNVGASFTINAPTFITNPACFDYVIIN
jgi:hypothetical protein